MVSIQRLESTFCGMKRSASLKSYKKQTKLTKFNINNGPAIRELENMTGSKKSRKTRGKNGHVAEPNDVNMENRYAMLSDDDNSDILPSHSINPKRSAPEKTPPIVVKVPNMYTLSQKLSQEKFSVSYKNMSIGTAIITHGIEEFKRLIEVLKSENVPYFTHDIKSEKPLKVVLRGLHEMPEDEIKQELTNRNLCPLGVFKMKRKQTSINFRDQPYLIHFDRKQINLSTLKQQVPTFMYTVINWEAYIRRQEGPLICNNCLIHGHGSKNCSMPPRCNTCGQNHRTSDCKVLEPAIKKCANCGQNHPANSSICPRRQEYIAIREKIRTKQNQKRGTTQQTIDRSINSNNNINSGYNSNEISYSNFQINNNNSSNVNHGTRNMVPTYSQVVQNENIEQTENNNSIFSPTELLKIFDEMTTKLSSCNNKLEQIKILWELTTKYVYGG